jgi:hypothetical protein
MSAVVMPDILEQWIGDCADVTDPQAFTTTRPLYASWKSWSEARGMSPTSERAFVFGLRKNFERRRFNYGRGFKGLRITENTRHLDEGEPRVSPIAGEPHPPHALPEANEPPDYEVLGPAPEHRCCACAQLGNVMRIKYRSNVNLLHERCAARIFAAIRRS